ncbi:MAG: acetylxylan esterase [Armatimonadota bacterium]
MRKALIGLIVIVSVSAAHATLPPEWSEWLPALTRQPDFYSHWSDLTFHAALSHRPPAEATNAPHVFADQEGRTCHIQVEYDERAPVEMPVLHLTDCYSAGRHIDPLRGRVTMHATLFPDAPPHGIYDLTGLPDVGACMLSKALTDARAALHQLLSDPRVTRACVGIVGEGLGGAVGVALSVLEPDLVAFVASHQPVPGFHFLPDGTRADSEAVLEPVQRLPSAVRKHGHFADSLTYFDFYNFAPEVRRPTLVTLGLDDEVATPEQVLSIYNRLTCHKRLEVLEGAGHLDAASRTQFLSRSRAWLSDLGFCEPSDEVPQPPDLTLDLPKYRFFGR